MDISLGSVLRTQLRIPCLFSVRSATLDPPFHNLDVHSCTAVTGSCILTRSEVNRLPESNNHGNAGGCGAVSMLSSYMESSSGVRQVDDLHALDVARDVSGAVLELRLMAKYKSLWFSFPIHQFSQYRFHLRSVI